MAIITGSGVDDVLTTTLAADDLTALGGNDIILIGLAADYAAGEKLSGGPGFDRLWFHSTTASDSLVLTATATEIEAIQIGDVVGNTTGTVALNVNASLLANGVILVGNDGDNILVGTARDDVIVGNGGVDTLTGGAGNDRIVMRVEAGALDAANAGSQSEGNTLALVGTAAGTLVVDLRIAGDQLTTIGGIGEALVQSGFSHVDASALLGFGVTVTGTGGANVLIGSALGDVLEGGAGLDVVSGGAGDDFFLVAAGTDQLAGETVSGGTGTDILRFTSTTAGQTLTLGVATTGLEQAEIASAAGVTTGTTALNLSAAAVKSGLILVGNDGANTLTGTAFDDVLNGNGGADTLYGGAGNDHYLVDSGADGVAGDRIVDSAGKEDLLFFTSTTNLDVLTLGATLTGIETIYLSGEDKDLTGTETIGIDATASATGVNVLGNDGANAITGSARNDTLTGGGGSDVIAARGGADTVVMDVDAASLDSADGGEAAEGNTLRLTGSAAGQIIINLAVAAGADQLLSIDGVGEALTQSDFTHVDADGVVGFGVDVTGSALANTIVGTEKDDILAGGLGIDNLQGGKGNDLFLVGSASEYSAAEKTNGGDGFDTLRFTSTTANQTLVLGALTTGLEEARISDAAGVTSGTTALNLNGVLVKSALILTGNDGNNTLTGTTSNDTLTGNGGADILLGGLGNDTYVYAAAAELVAGEKIIDVGGSGDTLKFTSATPGETLVLSAGIVGVETFLLDGSATIGIDGHLLTYGATFTGNTAANAIVGSARNDRIEGKEGNDAIFAGAGDDTVLVSVAAADVDSVDAGSATEGNTLALTGVTDGWVEIDLGVAAGADQLLYVNGLAESLVQSDFRNIDASKLESSGTTVSHSVWVVGSSAANTIVGTDGDDVFEPGLGVDHVEGGKGADMWLVYSQAEYNGDTYTDNGDDNNDWLHFVGTAGQTLALNNNTDGVDGAACGYLRSDTTNLNLNAAAVTHPFGLMGNAGDNILIATFNGESIFDYGGNDRMYGGEGDDDYVIVDQSCWTDRDLIADKGGYDDLYFCDPGSGVLTVGRYVIGVERFVVSGSDLSDSGPYRRDNTTTNGAGIDASAQAGPIFLAGNEGDNLLVATRAADTIKGHGGQDTIVAGAGADDIYMEVAAGSVDAIDAGALIEGNRLLLTKTPAGVVVVDLSAADQVVSIDGVAEGLSQTGFMHVDASAVEGDFGVDVTGTAGINKLTGSANDDVLRGGLGVDTLIGGAGNDAFVIGPVTEYSAGEVMDGGAGNDTVRFASTVAGQTLVLNPAKATGLEAVEIADAAGVTSGTTALNANLAAYGSAMSLTGNDGNNILYGTRFDDFIKGNGGADTLYGGAGNDAYLFDDGSDSVPLDKIVDAAGTADVMRFISATVGDTLVLSATISGVERLEISDRDGVLTGTTALNVSAAAMTVGLLINGNDGDNAITGTTKADTLYGNGGHDVIDGGGGADTIHMALEAATLDDVDGGARSEGNLLVLSGTAAGAMVWDLSSDTDQLVSINGADEGRTFRDVTHLDASLVEVGALTVTGSAEANTLTGTRFDDLFIVLAGAHATGDRITGGDGTDRLRFASTTPGDSLLLGAAIKGIEEARIESAAGDSSGTATLGLNAAAVGNALILSGNDGANAITGTAFGDDIEGRGGADAIVAGKGADIVRMRVEAADLDAADGGLIDEGNTLVLAGTAAGAMVVNLTAADQIASINGVAEALLQSGFANVDASAVTTVVDITGTAADNRLQGGADHDTIVAGAGADTITMDITATGIDDIDAGAATEGNALILVGAAAGNAVIDLTLAGDQLTTINGVADARVQSGFAHVDASAMTGGAVILTGTAAANNLSGTAAADTIVAGGGADRITMDLGGGQFDAIDAGAGSEGDTLVLKGSVAGKLVFDLSVAPGADQLISRNGVAEGTVQSDFQHVDASGLSGTASVDIRGNAANNILTGTTGADTLAGLGGADTLELGPADTAADVVVYESAADGFGSAAVAFSYDRILSFESGTDVIEFAAGFNGGINDLDDIIADDTFVFGSDAKANFSLTHEALFLTAAKTKLTNAAVLHQTGFAAVAGAINKVGVQAVAGDDGLIAVQAGGSTGLYYYLESDGIANKVGAGELTLLGVVNSPLEMDDLIFA